MAHLRGGGRDVLLPRRCSFPVMPTINFSARCFPTLITREIHRKWRELGEHFGGRGAEGKPHQREGSNTTWGREKKKVDNFCFIVFQLIIKGGKKI